jgi:hypothetical protein
MDVLDENRLTRAHSLSMPTQGQAGEGYDGKLQQFYMMQATIFRSKRNPTHNTKDPFLSVQSVLILQSQRQRLRRKRREIFDLQLEKALLQNSVKI